MSDEAAPRDTGSRRLPGAQPDQSSAATELVKNLQSGMQAIQAKMQGRFQGTG